MERQTVRPAALLLAITSSAAALFLIGFGLRHSRARHVRDTGPESTRSAQQKPGGSAEPEEPDDPNQLDVIAVGDPADAPEPARRGDGRYHPVHRTVLIHLSRFGPQSGLIPDSPAGKLLYRWLAAFNQSSPAAMDAVLPSAATSLTTEAQMQLRQQTGGYNLLSAREVEPGILVFRLRDQTPDGNEALGTLQMRPDSIPPTIQSFSLRTAAIQSTL